MNSILLFQSHTTGKIAHYYHLQWALSTYDSLLLVSLNINPVLEAVARFSFHSFISNVSIYTLSGQELSTNKNKTHALSMQYHRNNVSRNIITTQYAKQVQSRKLLSACLQCWKKSQQQQQQKSVCLGWMLRLIISHTWDENKNCELNQNWLGIIVQLLEEKWRQMPIGNKMHAQIAFDVACVLPVSVPPSSFQFTLSVTGN